MIIYTNSIFGCRHRALRETNIVATPNFVWRGGPCEPCEPCEWAATPCSHGSHASQFCTSLCMQAVPQTVLGSTPFLSLSYCFALLNWQNCKAIASVQSLQWYFRNSNGWFPNDVRGTSLFIVSTRVVPYHPFSLNCFSFCYLQNKS